MSFGQTIAGTKDVAQALSYWVTSSGILIAILGGISVTWRFFLDRRRARWEQARDLYSKVVATSLDHPEFIDQFWIRRGNYNSSNIAQYIVFMRFLLWSIEEIISLDRRVEWRAALKCDLLDHVEYLNSAEFVKERNGYFEALRNIIDEVLVESRVEVLKEYNNAQT